MLVLLAFIWTAIASRLQLSSGFALFWRHPQRAVDADRLAVDVAVLYDVDGERGIFGRLSEAGGERHRGAERVLRWLRQAGHHRRHENARRNRVDPDAELRELARDRQGHR